MATPTDTRLGTGRRFGIELGAACVAVALLLFWRDARPGLRTALLVAGILLTALGVLRPALLAPIATRWLMVGQRMAAVTTPIVLTLIYLLVVTPIGIVRRTFARSPIRRDRSAATFWVRREESTAAERRAAMEHQF
ncbi:MAG: hypothetical protein JWL60_977 [Gemmatimonadetes bacterium]|jgi:hypothetical protein|nr:hypothetical protein [Gemmatimonadota bacterium]